MARIKVRKPQAAQSRGEFDKFVDEVARMDVEIEKKEAELKKKHQELDDKFGEAIKRLANDRDELMQRAEPFFFEHQSELCAEGRREGATKLARFGVRLGNPSVTKAGAFKKLAWKALGAVFHASDALRKFTRETFEVDKDRILAAFRDAKSEDADVKKAAEADVAVLEKNAIGVEQTDQFWVEPIADVQVKGE